MKPLPTASRVCQVVRWILRHNRRQCLPGVGSKRATAVPVASTERPAIGQPSTGTAAAAPSIGTAPAPSTAEAPLDSEDKTPTERTYIAVYVNKQTLIQILNKYGWFKHFDDVCSTNQNVFSLRPMR